MIATSRGLPSLSTMPPARHLSRSVLMLNPRLGIFHFPSAYLSLAPLPTVLHETAMNSRRSITGLRAECESRRSRRLKHMLLSKSIFYSFS